MTIYNNKQPIPNKMQVFLTDYASYNAGTQFKYGHWVDLTNHNADSFSEYVSKHFASVGIDDAEPMFTDYDGFDHCLYSECDMANFFKAKKIFEKCGVSLCNFEHNWDDLAIVAQELELYDGLPVPFNSEGVSMICGDDAMAIVEAVLFGNVKYNHGYIYLDDYDNLQSCNNALGGVDSSDIYNTIIDCC